MSVGKIVLLLVNLKYLIILIIYFHLQNLCSSKSVSRHLLIIILIFFPRGGELGESWGMESLPINYFSKAAFLGSSPLACRAAVGWWDAWRGLGADFNGALPFPKGFWGPRRGHALHCSLPEGSSGVGLPSPRVSPQYPIRHRRVFEASKSR